MSRTPEPTTDEFDSADEHADLPAQCSPGTRGLLIVDDHEVVRWGLRSLIQAHSRPTSEAIRIFEAQTLAGALAVFTRHQAEIDLVFLDPGLPDTAGLSGLKAFREQCPLAPVVVVSGDSDPETMAAALEMGARAYLKKTGDLTEIIDYLRTHGLLPAHETDPDRPWNAATLQDKFQGLSVRQIQILDWILLGKSNREIGDLAFLAKGTVKNHVTTLLLHFGVKTRAQLISALR